MPNTMKVPSGRRFGALDFQIMEAAVDTEFIRWHDEPKSLASGRKSHVYVYGREDTTENPHFLRLCCRKILFDTKEMLDRDSDPRTPRFIGIPHVAHGWTPAITMVDVYENITGRHYTATHAIMRSEQKAHGAHKNEWIARSRHPKLQPLYRDIQFDNTVTDMGSKVTATNRMIEDGLKANELDGMVFVDRQQGGLKAMETLGYRSVHANYLLLDMAFAFQHLNRWPPDAVERLEREIRENQI